MAQLPTLFIERLQRIIPEAEQTAVFDTFNNPRVLSIRVNTLKKQIPEVLEEFQKRNIPCQKVAWSKNAFILSSKIQLEDLVEDGQIYIQNCSSMLVPLILDPQPGENILDMCSAPGSKATQMAALMNNQGRILCLENVKNRFYKLQSVVKNLGAANIEFKLMDARRFRPGAGEGFFDRILLDAPCSSEGRFHLANQKSYQYWSLRKVKEMVHKQKGLFLNAMRLLKAGGALVYATCTFAPEENEGVIHWAFRKVEQHRKEWGWHLETMSVSLADVKTYPAILQWDNKAYNPQVQRCIRILPAEAMDGFFIAKLIKIKD